MRLTTLAALALAGFSFCQPCLAATQFDPACVAEIKAILSASVNSGPFRLVSTQNNTADGVPIVSTFAMVPPNALHSVSTLNGQPTEMTFVDGRGFMKLGDTWTELPPEQAATMTAIFAPETLDASFANIEWADCGTPQVAYGKPVLAYHLRTKGSSFGNDMSIFIDPETRLPVEVYQYPNVEGRPAAPDSDNFYTYDPTITIKAPL